MSKFLHKVAEHLLQKQGNNLSAVTVLTPTRRSCIFLRQALLELAPGAVWLPEIITLQDWVYNKSSLVPLSSLELILELHEVFKAHGGDETLDEFIPVAQVMLEDFNEVDRQLTDAPPFFRYLEELQSLKVYVPGEEPDEFALRYRKFWRLFRASYFGFKEKSLSTKRGYEGLIYREVAENIEKPASGDGQMVLLGFNYLSKSEEKIVRWLQRYLKAEIIWDADRYFVDDEYQEAGMFLRKYIREWKPEKDLWTEDLIGTDEKQINIIGVAKSVGQAKVTTDILSSRLGITAGNEANTVIVVPDETMLSPLLDSLPARVEAYNISMGYPLRESQAAKLLELIFSLHDNAEKFQSEKHPSPRFHFRNVLDLLHHPYSVLLISDKSAISGFIDALHRRNRVLVRLDEIKKAFDAWPFDRIFWYTGDLNLYLAQLAELLESLHRVFVDSTKIKGEDRSTDIEILFSLNKAIRNIQNVISLKGQIMTVQSLRKLLRESIRMARVPFEGEPVTGLQVMGALETRMLDFENVIILSMNEGVFPSGKRHNSYIPMEVKREFLSTYREKDAEAAYLFLRLLKRAKNVFLLYNTESDELGGGEKSRFILQLQHELQKANSRAQINDLVYSVEPPPRLPDDELVIYKDEKLLAKLSFDLNSIGISPSAINTYINCSLQYYLRYTANLREQDEIEESIEAATLGSAVHEVLEKLYKEKLGQDLTADFVSGLLSGKERLEMLVKEALAHRFDEESLKHGKNYLLYRVCLKLLNGFLKQERKHLTELEKQGQSLKLLLLEETMEQAVRAGEYEVKIKGKVDRVEETEGVISVADYKTGSPRWSAIKTDNMSDFSSDPKFAKAMQLLTYAWLYWRRNGSGDIQLRPGIYWLRQISEGFDALALGKTDLIGRDVLMEFEAVLTTVLNSLLDPAIPFQKTSDAERCRSCEFIRICRRE